MYDILIKGGMVFDGSGKPAFRADIGIDGEKITGIGDLGGAKARKVINAEGFYVTPGFIDLTNHSDTHLTLFKYPLQESLVMQGVTTIIGGNCGSSLAPLAHPSAIQSIQKWADPSEINVNWLTFGEFLGNLEKNGLGLNFGSLVGYGTLRRGIVESTSLPASLEEREKIKILLKSSLEEGAFGLSSGLAYSHEKNSSADEIASAVSLLNNKGVYSIHLRSEGKELLSAVNEALQIVREGGVSIHISHFKTIGKKSWPDFAKAISMIEKAKNSGIDITFDIFPYKRTGSLLYLLLPAWSREGGFKEMFNKFSNQKEREKIIDGLKTYTLHYDKIFVAIAKNRLFSGKTIQELADSAGKSPEETILDILKASDGRVIIFGRTLAAKNNILALNSPLSMVSSDGAGYSIEEQRFGNLVHPRCFGAFPHYLHHFIRDRKILGWEEGIKKITGSPAKKFGIRNRGLIENKYYADIVVMDLKDLKDHSTYKNPYRYPSGIRWVIINGKIAAENGQNKGVKAGKILRKNG